MKKLALIQLPCDGGGYIYVNVANILYVTAASKNATTIAFAGCEKSQITIPLSIGSTMILINNPTAVVD